MSSLSASISTAPLRATGLAFTATVIGIVASPWPDVRSALIHDPSTLIVHWHSREVPTATVLVPPEEANDAEESVAETAHLLEVGATTDVDAVDEPHAHSPVVLRRKKVMVRHTRTRLATRLPRFKLAAWIRLADFQIDRRGCFRCQSVAC